MFCFLQCYKKLWIVGIPAPIGHGEQARASVLHIKVFIFKFISINGLSSCSIMFGDISPLDTHTKKSVNTDSNIKIHWNHHDRVNHKCPISLKVILKNKKYVFWERQRFFPHKKFGAFQSECLKGVSSSMPASYGVGKLKIPKMRMRAKPSPVGVV